MGDPETKVKRSTQRKRNMIAKKMWEAKGGVRKVHLSAKDREKQRKWRMKDDPEGDYDTLDDWLMRKDE